MDITAVSFVTLDGLKEFLKKCKETFSLKKDCDERWDSITNYYNETLTDITTRLPSSSSSSSFFSGIRGSMFCGNYWLKSVNLPALKAVSVLGAFSGCINLEKATLPACVSVGTSAFYNCTSLANIDLPACTSVGNYAFYNCTSLANIDLPACTSVGTSAFYGCIALASVNIPLCTKILATAFSGCTALKTINLPACISALDTSFENCDNLTEIHFAAANQATIEALAGYASKFGATNATIYFDL